jgi:hypothetical protein
VRVSLNLLIFLLLRERERERERESWYKFLLLGFFFGDGEMGDMVDVLSTGSEEVVSTISCV